MQWEAKKLWNHKKENALGAVRIMNPDGLQKKE